MIRSPLISQCFVYGDSLQNHLVAIVVPDEQPVRTWASKDSSGAAAGLAQATLIDMCKSDILKKAILEDIEELSQSGKLNRLETVRAIHLDSELFSVDNGLLTPTFKMKRKQLQEKYERVIESLYASMPPPRSKL